MKNILFSLILFPLTFQAQVSITDQSSLGGVDLDSPADVINAPDGGYYVLINVFPPLPSGNVNEACFGDADNLLVKFDINHNVEWQKCYGGSGGEGAVSLKLIDNELFLIGHSNSPASGNKTAINMGFFDVWVVKTDLDGNIIWDKSYGGNQSDICEAVTITDNGSLLIASTSYSGISGNKTTSNVGLGDYWIFEIDVNGDYIWEKTLGSDQVDQPKDIVLFENQIYITGSSQGGATGDKSEPLYGFADYWVVKTNETGDLMWDKALGTNDPDLGSSKFYINVDSIQVFNTGSNPMSGMRTIPRKGIQDTWRVSLSHNGDVLSQKAYGGNNSDGHNQIIELNGNLLLMGSSDSDISIDKTEDSKGQRDLWPLMLDNYGEINWQKTIGGSNREVSSRMLVRPNDKLLLVCSSNSTVSGDKTTPNYGDYDTWIVELDITSLSNDNFSYQDFTVYPNPFQDNILLSGENLENVEKVEIIDALGKVVSSNNFSNDFNKSTISISTEGVASGSYILNVTTTKGVQSYKMVK